MAGFALLEAGAASGLCLTALLIWRWSNLQGRQDVALSLCAGAVYFLYQTDPLGWQGLLIFVLIGPWLCNRAVRSCFSQSARPLWLDVSTLGLLLGLGVIGYIWPRSHVAALGFDVASLIMFLEIPLILWRGLSDDLVEIRRQSRFWCLGLGGLLSLAIAVASVLGQGSLAAAMGSVATLGLCGFVVAWRPAKPVTAVFAATELDDREVQILRRLDGLMTTDRLYLDPNLTLSRLAQSLSVPEHRLRRVIHQGLGQRHFSGFINGYRLCEVRRDLDDPAKDDEPLISLAYAAGYSSLSVFNRAFKAAEGVTPSVFREARRAARAAMIQARPVNRPDGTSAA